jgi:hypothetical protein
VTMSDDNKYEVLKEEERSIEDSVARTSDRDFIVEGSEDVETMWIFSLWALVPVFHTKTCWPATRKKGSLRSPFFITHKYDYFGFVFDTLYMYVICGGL